MHTKVDQWFPRLVDWETWGVTWWWDRVSFRHDEHILGLIMVKVGIY